MEFTVTFIELTFWSLCLVAPLLGFLCFVIIVSGQIVCSIEKWEKFDAYIGHLSPQQPWAMVIFVR